MEKRKLSGIPQWQGKTEAGQRGAFPEEKGRLLLSAAKDLEKQAVQLSSGWEKELAIALSDGEESMS